MRRKSQAKEYVLFVYVSIYRKFQDWQANLWVFCGVFFGHAESQFPGQGSKIGPLAVKVLNPNHWTTREFPSLWLKKKITTVLIFAENEGDTEMTGRDMRGLSGLMIWVYRHMHLPKTRQMVYLRSMPSLCKFHRKRTVN